MYFLGSSRIRVGILYFVFDPLFLEKTGTGSGPGTAIISQPTSEKFY